MSACLRGFVTILVGVSAAWPVPGHTQPYRATVSVSFSAPLPQGIRGEMASDRPIGSATHGGPLVSVGVERGTGTGLRIEGIYSRHSSRHRDILRLRGVEQAFAAKTEETAGVMASVLVPLARVRGSLARVTASAGMLRTRLRGSGTVGGDVLVPVVDSQTAPAVGMGFELPIPWRAHDVVLGVRGAQLLSRKRGGGYLAGGVGLRW